MSGNSVFPTPVGASHGATHTNGTDDIQDATAAQKGVATAAQITKLDGLSNYTHPNHTGDVTSVADGAQTIAANAVTLAKMADIATQTFLGRTTAATGDPEALTLLQATALLNVFTSSLKGLAPASGGGTTKFLRADVTWAVPPGGGGGSPTYEAHTSSDTLTEGETGSIHSNKGASGIITLTLPASPATNVSYLIIREAAFALRVAPNTGQNFQYSGSLATTVTKYLEIDVDDDLGLMEVLWNGSKWVVIRELDSFNEEA